jgi:subtilisin family serine protease
MRKFLLLLVGLAMSIISPSQDLLTNVDSQVIVVPTKGQEEKAKTFLVENNVKIVQNFDQLGWYLTQLPMGLSYPQFEIRCKSNSSIKKIYKDEKMEYKMDYIPNDPLFSVSWHLKQTTDADIDADESWDLLPLSNPYVTVAVFDGGLDVNHEDLVGRYNNPFNAATNQSTAALLSVDDKHGTACTGTICATPNNSKGTGGVGGNVVQVQPICIMTSITSTGSFSTSASIQINAINAAMANPTCVAISMSYGGDTFSQALSDAFTYAQTNARNGKGMMIFASSGNGYSGTATPYPAQYTSVWGVGATTSSDVRSTFSNYGTIVDISAPGSAIQTTDRTGTDGYNSTNYAVVSGTSFSCPITSGVAAMIAYKNYELTSTQIFGILSNTCDKVGGYVYTNMSGYPYSTRSVELGYGRINAKTALQQTPNPGSPPPPPPTPKHNLLISGVSVTPSNVNIGQVMTINCLSTTQNPELSTVNTIIQYRYSNDNTWGNSDDIIIGTDTTTLGGGISSGNESISFIAPSSPGARYILVRTNYQFLIEESFTGDNTNSVVFNIVDPLLLMTDGKIEFVLPSTTGTYSTNLNNVLLRWKLTNTGTSVITNFVYTKEWINCSGISSFVPCATSSTWTGNLLPGQSVLLPSSSGWISATLCQTSTNCAIPTGGSNTYKVTISNVNGYNPDANPSNNVATCLITRTSTTTTLDGVDHIEVFDIRNLNNKPTRYDSNGDMKLESGFYVIHTYYSDGRIEIEKLIKD